MPKICTEKFDSIGKHMGRTTSTGRITFDLHFSVQDNNFYFDRNEIREKFPDLEKQATAKKVMIGEDDFFIDHKNPLPNFSHCYTRRQAVMAMEIFLRGEIFSGKITKVLVIEMAMPVRTAKPNMQPDHIRKMLGGYFSESRSWDNLGAESQNFGIALKFKRLYKIERNDTVIYADSIGVWKKPNVSELSYGNQNAVDWTPELEAFLIKMQNELERICTQTLEFLKTDNLNELNEKIKSTTLALNPVATNEN